MTRPVASSSFSPALFAFLRELRDNNDRAWFNANKERFEESVREPGLDFVADFAPFLAEISAHFVADPRPVGGSLFRIHRDTRFARDKSPYKTHTGIHFRHEQAKDVHAPGFYLHLEPRQVFAAAGIWHPDAETLGKLREAIAADPDRWRKIKAAKPFSDLYRLGGDSLKRPPAGYDASHPLIDDLKRKDFIAVTSLKQRDVTSAGFLEHYAETCRAAAPFARFLCDATGVPF